MTITEKTPIVTKLTNLAKNLSQAVVENDNQTLVGLEERIKEFLSEEAVLNRTSDCFDYFKHHIQAFPHSSKVTFSF